MTDEPDPRVIRRAAELLPEEERAGSADPIAQAEEIILESDERTLERDPDAEGIEHRRSEDTVSPPDLPE